MTPEQRREMIVAAALPLVAENGAAVTTAQVARAAGIGEGTIFRVFAGKDELLDACMAEAMRPDHAVREIASISLDQPLAARLREAAEAVRAGLERLGAVAGALQASGRPRSRGSEPRRPLASREASMAAIGAAIAELLEPERDSLRLSCEQTASLYLGLLFTRTAVRGPAEITAADLVEVFLGGALTISEGRA
ncbi:TetR/AcrR family transcriptional regulator [Saccharopolyspora erythraea]|nr:TetR/AcrR family transcriptional regulator [Saccharopolyspora erythraea]QUH05816.1 TetR/AcrR family transcriptional regulator [Saccharopolyspora erythraea]